jgi:hypothetical protein
MIFFSPILAEDFPRGRAAERAVTDAAERLHWLTYTRPAHGSHARELGRRHS